MCVPEAADDGHGVTAGTWPTGLGTVLREWGRIGVTGFGGPPAHIALLRRLCVDGRGWLDAAEFEDAIAACNLLPGPASTELAIFCAWRVRGRGALSFGGGFVIIPLMQADAVGRHWMTNDQFLNAVALGQITPGPVVQTVSAVGYAASQLPGGLLAAVVAFAPSFAFVLGGGPR